MRYLNEKFGLGHTFEESFRFYDYEQYFVLFEEFSLTMISSLVAVMVVILVISSNITITLFVGICIICTDILLMGLVYYWGLTLNPMVMM